MKRAQRKSTQRRGRLIDEAVVFAEAAPDPDPSSLMEYVYA